MSSQPLQLPPPPPPPNGQVLALLAALSNPSGNHELHIQAIKARDDALSSSQESYGNLCQNFARILSCPTLHSIPPDEIQTFHNTDPTSLLQLRHEPTLWIHFRQMAGLLLKNALVSPPPSRPRQQQQPVHVTAAAAPPRMTLPPPAAVEIKNVLLRCITDENHAIRGAASSTIASATIVDPDIIMSMSSSPSSSSSYQQHYTHPREPALPLNEWKELLPYLLHCLHSSNNAGTEGNTHATDGALLTIRKMLEDSATVFQAETEGADFDSLVPTLLHKLHSPVERWRKEALKCLHCLIVSTMPGCLVVRMEEYLNGLSVLAVDESAGVRRLVCQAIVSLLSTRTEYVHPHLPSIAEFMLTSTTDADPSVALEACDFWLTFASLDDDVCTADMMDTIRAILPRLVPVLLRGMVYPQDKREELLEQNAQDERQGADRSQDIAPVFHKTRKKGGGGGSGGSSSAIKDARDAHDGDNNEVDSDLDDDDDDDDDDEDEDGNEWTLRKCSAASLDTLAGMFGPEEILPPLLPALQEGLSHTDPWVREASILALGAIADGCRDAMTPHMGQLHPYLMTQLTSSDSLPQLKSISAWTLSRYADWAVEQVHSGTQPEIVGTMTEALMARVLDRNRRVQIASCSAFGVLVEATGDMMVPYLEPVYRTLVSALGTYQTRSLMILFDTLGVMADFVGPAIGEGSLPGIYVPPLLRMWDNLAKHNPFDKTLLPLMESLASIALVIEMNFQPWALETFDNAMGMIEACTLLLSASDGDIEDEEADPIVCAADLLDGLVEGLGENFAALVASSKRYGEHFLTVLDGLAGHDVPGVRMSAFALVGDLARQAPTVIQSGLHQLLSKAVDCIDPMHPSVCNNAVWAIGEVCVRCGENAEPLQPFAKDIIQNLISLLMGNAVNADGNLVTIPGLAENAAATMGRLAKVNANFVAGDLPRFLTGWCDGMAKISDTTERRDAFQGFIIAVHANPQSIQTATANVVDTITAILFAVVSWHLPSDLSQNILQGEYQFQPFPAEQAELGTALIKLLHDLKNSVGEKIWGAVEKQMPVNVRRLMREAYHI